MTPAPTQNTAPAGGTGTHRDPWGIPHLWADSADALAYLQGMNAATDRSWQIELERWRSEGRTAEMLGAAGLDWDRLARQARLDDTARRCFEGLDADTRRWCARYVAGINQALADGLRGGPEFEESGTSPAPWNPWTPLGVFLVQHILFSTFPNKLFRAHVARTLGPDAVGLFSIEAPVWSGSNAWAVHGSATASGQPLIAGDPHRLLELPGVYQQVRLACPEFDAVGFAFPGVPGLPHFGHTGHTAWAITNAMADYQDLFEEELRRDPTGTSPAGTNPPGIQARGPLGWESAVVERDTILVRGGASEEVEVIETIRGPVIAGGPDGGGALSLRFPARVEGRLGFESLLPLLRSRSVADVATALQWWVEPVNSVIAADAEGGVRHFLAGLVPQRSHNNRRVPVPASRQEYSWNRIYLPLPGTAVTRFAVSANDRAAGGGDAVGMEFAPAHRARRIRELLEAKGAAAFTIDDMQAIHADTLLGPWPQFRGLMEDLEAGSLTAGAAGLRSRLLVWDGHMDARSQEAVAFARWRGFLVRRIARHAALAPLAAPTGYSPLFGPWLSVASRVGFALETLLLRGAELGISPAVEAAAALEEAALQEAALREAALREAAGIPGQLWGERHQLLAVHELPGSLANSAPTAPLSGDTGCVLSTESLPGIEDRSFRGPVARYVWDLSDREQSRWIVPFGAAGNPGHPHFADQLPLWAAGELIPVVTDWALLTLDIGHTAGSQLTSDTPAHSQLTKEAMNTTIRDYTARTTIYSEELKGWGSLRIVPLAPAEDLDLIYQWVTQPRARFWGMTEHTREDVLGIYEFLDSLETHHAFLVVLDGEPMALFQTYEPLHDPVGEAYAAREEDIGMHLLLAPAIRPVPHFTPRLATSLIHYMFSVPGKDRIVVEPDARNTKALRRLDGTCFELGPVIQLAEKEAQLAFLTRERFDRAAPLRSR